VPVVRSAVLGIWASRPPRPIASGSVHSAALISPGPDGVVMTRFLLAVLIGIGLTLAWQSYGEDAKQIVGPWARDTIMSQAPSLAWLLPSWRAPQVDAAPNQTRSTPFGDITGAEVAPDLCGAGAAA
jgi:hypothetical protein